MPHKHGDTNLKKTKIRDLIMNNNVAPNNMLVGDTWIILLIKLIKNLLNSLQEQIIASHTNNHQNHHVIS